MVNTGNVTFDGLTRESAKALLEAADRAGVDRKAVRTTSTGFVVPEKVAEALTRSEKKDTGKGHDTPPVGDEPKDTADTTAPGAEDFDQAAGEALAEAQANPEDEAEAGSEEEEKSEEEAPEEEAEAEEKPAEDKPRRTRRTRTSE